MPVSNDNQYYGKDDKKNKENAPQQGSQQKETKMTTDDLKGKKVDADPEKESGKPIEQKK